MSDYGTVTGPGTLRLERLLPGPIERVWAYLTESEKRGKWLASGEMQLVAGGHVELRFHHADLSSEKTTPERFKQMEGGVVSHGQVIRCEPPRLLTFSWGEGAEESEVTFELAPKDGKVLLVLTHRRLRDRSEMVSVAGGWHAHLGILADNLEGREPRPFWSTHAKVEAEYEKRIPAG
jgi:uncharacterized protein YndB with AHSA1/START domain